MKVLCIELGYLWIISERLVIQRGCAFSIQMGVIASLDFLRAYFVNSSLKLT